jgi:hypothetical protein
VIEASDFALIGEYSRQPQKRHGFHTCKKGGNHFDRLIVPGLHLTSSSGVHGGAGTSGIA